MHSILPYSHTHTPAHSLQSIHANNDPLEFEPLFQKTHRDQYLADVDSKDSIDSYLNKISSLSPSIQSSADSWKTENSHPEISSLHQNKDITDAWINAFPKPASKKRLTKIGNVKIPELERLLEFTSHDPNILELASNKTTMGKRIFHDYMLSIANKDEIINQGVQLYRFFNRNKGKHLYQKEYKDYSDISLSFYSLFSRYSNSKESAIPALNRLIGLTKRDPLILELANSKDRKDRKALRAYLESNPMKNEIVRQGYNLYDFFRKNHQRAMNQFRKEYDQYWLISLSFKALHEIYRRTSKTKL